MTWKSVVLKAAGFGAGVGLSLCLFVAAWGWYSSRPKPPKPWDTKAVSAEYDGVTTESDTNLGTTFVVYYTLQNNTEFDYELKEQGEQVLLAGQLEREKSASIDNDNLKGQFPLFIPARGRVRFALHLKYPYSGGAEPTEGVDAIHAYRAKVADFMTTELNNLNGFVLYDQQHRYEILFPKGWRKSKPLMGEAVKTNIAEWETAEVIGNCSRTKGILQMYSAGGAKDKELTLSCVFRNQTARAIPFDARPPRFEGLLHLPDGSTFRPTYDLYVASAQKQIPAHGQIEGGMFIHHPCKSATPDAECLESGLLRAEELFLTDHNTKARYRIAVK
jgi:hypothetical protein